MAGSVGHTFTIEYECGSGNDYDGRLGVRISSIFVIGLGSMLGMSAAEFVIIFEYIYSRTNLS